MRFLIIRKADEQTEAGVQPTTELLDAMTRYNEELINAGVLLDGMGLRASSNGAKVTLSKSGQTVVDGPFAEAKELVAGYTMIQARSLDEAIEWAKRWPPQDGGGNVELEIRQVHEADEFGEEFTPELRAREDRLRTQIADR